MIQKNILIDKNQEEFLKKHKWLNFSAFVRMKLNEKMKKVEKLNKKVVKD